MTVDPSATPTLPSAACLEDDICRQVYDWTGSGWIADGGYYLLMKPLKVIIIVLMAILARALLNKAIQKIVDRTSQGRVPSMLRPLKDKAPAAPTAGLIPERRKQRAEAIGSVLKSMVTATVFSIAALTVLSEFGFNLGPILTSLGIVGVALGFGAQTLVKDLIAGLFMLLEDQYGVGDVIDTGEAVGVVESVGLRTVTIRDSRGVLWYVRNGEIIRIGNKSQGWSQIVVDVPIGFVSVDEATEVLERAVQEFASNPVYAVDFIEPPQILGVEQITVDGAVIRATCRTNADRRLEVQRELRRRLTEALGSSGIAAQIQASRALRPAAPTGAPSTDSQP